MESKRIIASTLTSLTSFGILEFALHWNIFVAGLISAGLYYGTYYLTTPQVTQKTIDNMNNDRAQTLFDVLNKAHQQTQSMLANAELINNNEIQRESALLLKTAIDIIEYCNQNKNDLSQSQYFIEHYFTSAEQIIANYKNTQDVSLSQEHKDELTINTIASLKNLNKVFSQQLENYYLPKINALKIENELIEKTIEMGEFK